MRSEETEDFNSAGVLIDSEEQDTSEYTLGVRADYYFMAEGKVIPYAGLHLGYLMAETEWKDNSGNKEDIEYSGFYYGLQAGAKYFLSENIALDFELVYTIIDADGNYDMGFADADFDYEASSLELRAGVAVFF